MDSLGADGGDERWIQGQTVWSAALVAARDGSNELVVEHEAWIRDVFGRAIAEGEDPVHRLRDGIRFNPLAIATAGLASLWVNQPSTSRRANCRRIEQIRRGSRTLGEVHFLRHQIYLGNQNSGLKSGSTHPPKSWPGFNLTDERSNGSSLLMNSSKFSATTLSLSIS